MYAVNTTAVFLTLVAFLELLDKGNKAGNVEQKSQCVAISSAGAFNRVPMAGFAYGGSKAAVVHTMKQFATKLVPHGIRCNVIAPGCKFEFSSSAIRKVVKRSSPVPHPLQIGIRHADSYAVYSSDMTAELLKKSPSGVYPRSYIPAERVGDLKDMAGTILFLASRAGGYVNGNVLLTDGGRLSILPGTY